MKIFPNFDSGSNGTFNPKLVYTTRPLVFRKDEKTNIHTHTTRHASHRRQIVPLSLLRATPGILDYCNDEFRTQSNRTNQQFNHLTILSRLRVLRLNLVSHISFFFSFFFLYKLHFPSFPSIKQFRDGVCARTNENQGLLYYSKLISSVV